MRSNKLFVAAFSLCVLCVMPARAQVAAENGGVETHDGGTRETLESIVITPKPNAPFSLTLDTEWTRTLSDGNTQTVVNERHIARDSAGRIWEQRVLLEPKNVSGEHNWIVNVIQIIDPNAHTLYNCWMYPKQKKICEEWDYRGSTTTTYRPASVVTGPLPGGRGTAQHEDLGSQSVAGVATQGSRNTIRYSPGVVGNDREMVFQDEYWYSPELGINLISLHSDPRVGQQKFTVTEVTQSEPDPALFQLPADFRVVDRRDSPQPTGDATR